MFIYIAGRAHDAFYRPRYRIAVIRADVSGRPWHCVQELPIAEHVTGLVCSASGSRLYALHGEGGAISVYAIDPASGQAWPINRLVTGGLHPTGLASGRDGRFLLIAHAGSGHVSNLSVAWDGALQAVSQRLTLPGPAHPRDIALDPAGHFAVLADPGRNGLHVLWLARPDGQLSLHQFLRARPGDLPCRVVFHPRLPLLYVGNGGNSTVTAYHWHARAGYARFAQAIRTVPATWSGRNAVADLAFGRDGRRLYALNAGHDSVTMLAVQPGKGKMFVRARDATGGRMPSAFAWDDEKKTLLIAHETDHRVTSFAVSQVNGTISRVMPDMEIPYPAALAILG